MRLTAKARKAGYAVAALGCALATTVTAPPAANASAGAYCGTYGDGYTWQTVFTKQPPGCYDVNLTWVKWDGYYKGYLQGATGGWNPCNATVWHDGGQTYPQVLCSNVATGTLIMVRRMNITGQGWNYHINY
jgi:hypothetical protein